MSKVLVLSTANASILSNKAAEYGITLIAPVLRMYECNDGESTLFMDAARNLVKYWQGNTEDDYSVTRLQATDVIDQIQNEQCITLYRVVKVRSNEGLKALQECGWQDTLQYVEEANNGFIDGGLSVTTILNSYVTDAGSNSDSVLGVNDLEGVETEIVSGISNIATKFYTDKMTAYKIGNELWVTEVEYTNKFW